MGEVHFVKLHAQTVAADPAVDHFVCATSALAGDFIDTRVTFAFSDDNVFVKLG